MGTVKEKRPGLTAGAPSSRAQQLRLSALCEQYQTAEPGGEKRDRPRLRDHHDEGAVEGGIVAGRQVEAVQDADIAVCRTPRNGRTRKALDLAGRRRGIPGKGRDQAE